MKNKRLLGSIILLLASIVWGFAFVAQSQAAEFIEPFTLNFLRCYVGAIFLIPIMIINRKANKKTILETNNSDRKKLIISGVICGLFMFVAMNLQQFGISLYPSNAATSGRSGFITALYVVLVPLLGIFMKKKIGLKVLISVTLAVIGLYLLCFFKGIDHIYLGDLIVLLSALGFAFQIICIDKYANEVDSIKFSIIQFLVTGTLSMILMFIFEDFNINNILMVIGPILYLGIVSTGIGYTFQIIGQKLSQNPSIDSILMSFESVFAVIGGAIIMKEVLLVNEIIGCILMFIAIIISQIPNKKIKELP